MRKRKKIFLFATSFLVLISSLPQYSPPFACQPGSFPLPLDPAKEEEETAKQVQEGRRAPREKEVEVKGSIISSFFPLIFLPPSVRHIFFCEGKRKRERKGRKRKRKSNVGLRGGGGGRDGGGERKPACSCCSLSPASRPQPSFLPRGREGGKKRGINEMREEGWEI